MVSALASLDRLPPAADPPSHERVGPWPSPGALADMVVDALIDEAELTPKPALVDRRGSGAHVDLDLSRLIASALSLRPGFRAMAEASLGRAPSPALRQELAAIGREAERAMMQATSGSNAHRGAIWAMGLLVSGAAIGPGLGGRAAARTAGAIARFPDRLTPAKDSNGARVGAVHGVSGARGEAMQGFPNAVRIGLPALRASRLAGAGETEARLDALLAIMARLDDTCLLHRGGRPALDAAKAGALDVLAVGGTATEEGRRRLDALHDALMARNASPGGAADLLAATLFLDRIDGLAAASSAPRGHLPWNA